jgi:protein-tyrosine phosphatase
MVDMPADPQARLLMLNKSLNINQHRARQVTSKILSEAQLVLVMEKSHIQSLPSEMRARAQILGLWTGGDIADPYHKSPEYFAEILADIERGVDAWAAKLWR